MMVGSVALLLVVGVAKRELGNEETLKALMMMNRSGRI
jgi:hypothetical protein